MLDKDLERLLAAAHAGRMGLDLSKMPDAEIVLRLRRKEGVRE
jgi:hypothetical protein